MIIRWMSMPIFLLMALTCEEPPPEYEHAMTLYREGKIAEAHEELTYLLNWRPGHPDAVSISQHITLARRLMDLESKAVAQWQDGDLDGARNTLGVMRVLHPYFVDSVSVARTTLTQVPPPKRPPPDAAPASAEGEFMDLDEEDAADLETARDQSETVAPDSIPAASIDFVRAYLDAHERLLIHLSARWQEQLIWREGDPVRNLKTGLNAGEAVELLTTIDDSFMALREASGTQTELVGEVTGLATQLDQTLLSLDRASAEELVRFNRGFNRDKARQLRRIVDLRSGQPTPNRF